MRRITASRYGLARQCLYAFWSDVAWDEKTSYSSRLGSAFHEYADLYVLAEQRQDVVPTYEDIAEKHGLTANQTGKLDKMIGHWVKWLEGQDVSNLETERAYSYDPFTGEALRLKKAGPRDYTEAPADAYAMTTDVVDNRPGLPLVVSDYKTGYFVQHPADSAQMKLLAMTVAKVTGAPGVIAQIIKVQPGGLVVLDHFWTDEDLYSFELDAQRVAAELTSKPPPHPGDHCKICPAKLTCDFSTKKEAA